MSQPYDFLRTPIDPLRRVGFDMATRPAPSFSAFSNYAGGGAGTFAPVINAPASNFNPNVSPLDNPFQTVRNVKNPEIQNALSSVLAGIQGLSTNPALNTNVLKTTTKNPQAQQAITKGFGDLDAAVNNHNQSIADFAKSFLESGPAAQANTNQETAAIGEFYGPASDPTSVAANLNRLAANRSAAITANSRRAIAQAMNAANVGRLMSGDSSYTTHQAGNTLAAISAQAAREDADQRLKNYLTVKQSQADLAGRRNDLVTQLLKRQMLPIQFEQATRTGDFSNLGQLTNFDQANNFYQVDNPEALLARRLGLIGDVGANDQRNTFYGLRAPFQAGGNRMQFPNSGFNFDTPSFGNMFDAATGNPIRGGAPATQGPREIPYTGGISPHTLLLQDYYENPERYPNGMADVQRLLTDQMVNPSNINRYLNPYMRDTSGVNGTAIRPPGFGVDYAPPPFDLNQYQQEAVA